MSNGRSFRRRMAQEAKRFMERQMRAPEVAARRRDAMARQARRRKATVVSVGGQGVQA